jgi:uncharacterized protein YegP (UPF0339 family)
MEAKFVLKNGSTGKYRFNLVATNGQVIATSESHEGKASVTNGIESVTERLMPRSTTRPTIACYPLDACVGLAVPGRPIGPWSRRTGAPQAAATGRDRKPRAAHALLTGPSETGRNSAGRLSVGRRRRPK